MPTIYSVFPVYEVGTTAGQECPYGGDRANIMYPHSTAIKWVRSEDFSPHKTPSDFRRHYKLYNSYLTRHYIMTESIQDTSPRIHSFADSGPRNKKPVSDETCPPNLSVGSMLQSKIGSTEPSIVLLNHYHD